MTQTTIQRWQVYRLFTEQTKPPKHKYVVLTYTYRGVWHGFFINSKITKFVQKRPRLLVCQVEIDKSTHSFLKRDSWLDCRELYIFSELELAEAQFCGQLDSSAIMDVLEAVEACPVLAPKQKKRIRV